MIRNLEQVRQLRNHHRIGSLPVPPELRKQEIPPDLTRVFCVGCFREGEDLAGVGVGGGGGSGEELLVVRGGKGRTGFCVE